MFRKLMLTVLLSLFATMPALAQIGAAAGGTQDWIRGQKGAQWDDGATFMPGITYTLGLNDDGTGVSTKGLAITFRGSDPADAVQEYGVGWWQQIAGGSAELFGDVVFEAWGQQVVPDLPSRTFLGGLRVGLRGQAVEGLPVELSFRATGDRLNFNNAAHVGLFFGVYR